MTSVEPIARLLAQRGTLPEAALQDAAARAKSPADFLGSLLEQGVPEPDLVGVMAEHLGMPGVDLSRTNIDLAVLARIPRLVAESDLVLPLSDEGGRLHVAVNAAVENEEVLEELRFATGMEISAYAALPGPLREAITFAYDAKDQGESSWRGGALAADSEVGVAVILPGVRGETGPFDRGPPPAASAGQARKDELETIEEIETVEGMENLQDLDSLEDLEPLELEVGGDESEEEVLGSVGVRVGPARILAVDDDPEILRLLDRTLRSAGYAVELARDGREAEKKIEKERYDLILLDAMLPQVHGFELCARLKANARTRSVPVILCSAVYRGWRYASDVRETFGADDYLEKPFHLPDLLHRVAERLSGKSEASPQASEKAERLYQKGTGLLEAGQAAEARKTLEEAAREDPFSARAHFALAKAMQAQGDLFSALTEYERAVELRPNLFPALRALAGLYEEKGFRRKATEALERALHAAPDAESREAVRARLLQLL
ncbi:MAG: response regulator [Deltaproteobacteria bacterium]|nr:MAG: response regulator [Deltaproteobacteria bacterium]